jgi:hypothetical protein
VQIAKRSLAAHGWLDIEDLGKPYDLRCRRGVEEMTHVVTRRLSRQARQKL